jgi:hypothetical protein
MQPSSQCRTYATDVSDEEWKLLAPLFSGILSGFPLHLPVFISSCSPVSCFTSGFPYRVL